MHSIRLALLVVLLAAGWPLAVRGDDDSMRADEATLKNAGLAIDDAALLDFFRKRTLSDADRARLAQTVRLLGDNAFTVREKAAVDLIAAGRGAVPFLKAVLNDPDLEVSRRAHRCLDEIQSSSGLALILASARLIAQRKPADACTVVLNYLPFADDELVEVELLATLTAVGLPHGQADPVLVSALKDRVLPRRAAAALIVGRSSRAEERALVRPLLADAAATVRLRAAQSLLAGKEKDAVPALVELLVDAPITLAWQAEELLFRLAGDQAPPLSVGTGADAERKKSRDAWSAWWQAHGARADWLGVDLEQRALGLTLVVAFDGFGNQGKIWEARADGKPRWEIANLEGPIDAHMLTGSRVLIAEHNGRRVTERDLQGKILWEHPIANNQYPVACQRLPGGNTFIATYNQVFEVNAQGKEIFSYPCRQGIIYSAQKLRNGHIVYVTSNSLLVELDTQGKELRTLRIGPIAGWVTVEALPGGRFLVPQAGKVVELDGAGKEVTAYNQPNVNAATRLPNGNLLICRHNDRTVAEVDRAGKVLWEQRLQGRPFWARWR